MKAQIFNAVCPLEVGDKVIVMLQSAAGAGKPLEATYLPDGATIMINKNDLRFLYEICTVTDIATVHYFRSRETQFIYELDNCKKYQQLEVKMPAVECRK